MTAAPITHDAIMKLVDKGDLSYNEAYGVMDEIMSGATTPTQNAAYLAALSTKNARAETTEEIAGSAQAMRDHAEHVEAPYPVLEIVGTGGDRANSFNISTTAMFVIAAGGVKVAKHGNRAASSKSGTADCLEALGASLDLDGAACLRVLDRVGVCFMFAQKFHPAMKYVGGIRKELGVRTVFNILGPLTNPMHPEMFVMGVYDAYLVDLLAPVLADLGVKRGLVVYGQDRLDEISASAPTSIAEVNNGTFTHFEITPEQVGLTRGTKEAIVGGRPEENAHILRGILDGSIRDTRRDIVLLNAAAGLYLGGKAESLAEGVRLAGELIDSGQPLELVDRFVAETNRVAETDR